MLGQHACMSPPHVVLASPLLPLLPLPLPLALPLLPPVTQAPIHP